MVSLVVERITSGRGLPSGGDSDEAVFLRSGFGMRVMARFTRLSEMAWGLCRSRVDLLGRAA